MTKGKRRARRLALYLSSIDIPPVSSAGSYKQWAAALQAQYIALEVGQRKLARQTGRRLLKESGSIAIAVAFLTNPVALQPLTVSTPVGRRTRSAPWPKVAISNAPSRSCWSATPAPARVILPPAWLSVAVCRQRRRVRFTTAAALVNQLVEAQREQSLSRMLARWSRVELIVIDELGYVPLAEVAAELLFQIIAERAEKAAVIVTTNLIRLLLLSSITPFFEAWMRSRFHDDARSASSAPAKTVSRIRMRQQSTCGCGLLILTQIRRKIRLR